MVKRKNEIMTIGNAFEVYNLERKAKGCVHDTIANSEFAMKLFLEDNNLSERDPVQVLNRNIFISWSEFLQMQDLSPESINAYLSRMRSFVNWLIESDYLPYFKINLIKAQEQQIKFFTDEELEILCKKPKNDCDYVEYRTWVIICFILATGCRSSTLCDINLEDISDNRVYYRHLKNKQAVSVPLSNNIMNIINEYRRLWDIDSEYLFTDQYGNKLTVGACRQALKKYCSRRGVKPRGPHSLRHSFAKTWILNGGGLVQLQLMLNHKDLQMTRHYVNIFCSEIQKDVEEYSALEFFVKSNKKVKRA